MKKALLLALMGIMTATAAYAAPDRTGKFDLGVNVSAAVPDEGDTGAYVGGTLSYGINNWLAVGVESGWAGFDDSDSGIDVEQDMVPVFATAIFRVPMESQVQPYGVVGLGAIFWDVETNVPNVEVDVDTAFGVKLGGGLDWFINDNWIANFEFAYVISDADVTARNTITGASVSGEGDTDYWTIGGGLKYLFS